MSLTTVDLETKTVSQRLRDAADWLERHDVQPNELISVTASKWDSSVLLYFKGGERICHGQKVEFVDGYAVLPDFDGLTVRICEPELPRKIKVVTL